VTGLLDVADRVWPVLLFLALIQIVADLCDDAGLFDVSAHVAARVAGGSRLRLFLLFTLLATVCTWVLSIDTTAVLLAPIGLALAGELGLSALPFAFASVWLANTASLLLPVSNLTNLLAQSHLGAGGAEFVRATWLPQVAVLVVVLLVLLVRHRVALRGGYDVPQVLPSYDPVLLWLTIGVVVAIGPAIVAGVPAWVVALVASVLLVLGFAVRRPAVVRPGRLVRLVPWSVLAFAVVLFAVVEVIVEDGSSLLDSFFGTGDSLGSLFQLAGSTGVLANVVNNLPAYLVVEPFTHTTDRLVTALVAVNVGPMLLAWGSLANLLWLRACRTRGLEISMVRFGLEGLLVVPLAVAAGVLAVWLG
jgi:arsenical pump membrane protein